MNVTKRTATLMTALAVVTSTLRPGLAADPVDLEARFRQPPADAKPHVVWYFGNGKMTREGITADLEAMADVGIGGVMLGHISGTPETSVNVPKVKGMTPEWRELMKHTATEAARLGLVIDLWNGPGWTGGGGAWIKRSQSMQATVMSETKVSGPSAFTAELARPTVFVPKLPNGFAKNDPDYHDVAVLAFPAKDGPVARATLVDLTDKLQADGRLTWDVPAGEWIILRIGYGPTGICGNGPVEISGPDVDKFDRAAFDVQWQHWMKMFIDDWGPLVGKSLTRVHSDSWEVGDQNWNRQFREEFKRRQGYDPVPYLVVATGRQLDNEEISKRFLWDWRRTIADLMADNYFGALADKAREHGLQFSLEAYSMADFYEGPQAGARADIPMGEFWTDGSIGGKGVGWICPTAVSIGRNHARPIVGAEAFTGRACWSNSPRDLKPIGDLVYCQGINHYTLHFYAHQPVVKDRLRGTDMHWGNHLNRHNVWWPQSRAWIAYLTRCQALLQAGFSVADVCTFSGATAAKDSLPGDPFGGKYRFGYDFSGCDAETLLTRFTAKDGRIMLPDGNSYRLLILPDEKVHRNGGVAERLLTPAMALKLRELVHGGAVVLGPKPTRSPSLKDYPKCDAQVQAVADELWGAGEIAATGMRTVGKGRVYWGRPANEVLADMQVQPDVLFSSQVFVDWSHRQLPDADLYFLSNRRRKNNEAMGIPSPDKLDRYPALYQRTEASFRITGRIPELWDPVTGRMETAGVWREENGRTVVPLTLDPDQSLFVIFRKPAAGVPHLVSASWADADQTPTGARTVAFRADAKHAVRVEAWRNGTVSLVSSTGTTNALAVAGIPSALAVGGPWTLRFAPGWFTPEQVVLPELKSLTEHEDVEIRHFSGTVSYTRTLDVPAEMLGKERHLYLDLGEVAEIAEVTLNGKDLGIQWYAPYRVDITDVARPGANELNVRVTGVLENRFYRDPLVEPERRVTTLGGNRPAQPPTKPGEEPRLVPMGLIGPVSLVPSKMHEVTP